MVDWFNMAERAWGLYFKVQVLETIKDIINGDTVIFIGPDADEDYLLSQKCWDSFEAYPVVREEWTITELLSASITLAIDWLYEEASAVGDSWTKPDHLYVRLPLGRDQNPGFDMMDPINGLLGLIGWASELISNIQWGSLVQVFWSAVKNIDFKIPLSDRGQFWDESEETLSYGYDLDPPVGWYVSDIATLVGWVWIFKMLLPLVKSSGRLAVTILNFLFGLLTKTANFIKQRITKHQLVEAVTTSVIGSMDDDLSLTSKLDSLTSQIGALLDVIGLKLSI